MLLVYPKATHSSLLFLPPTQALRLAINPPHKWRQLLHLTLISSCVLLRPLIHSSTDTATLLDVGLADFHFPSLTKGIHEVIHQTSAQDLELAMTCFIKTAFGPLKMPLDTTAMSHTDTAQKLAEQLGLQRLYQLLPDTFHAAMKSAAELSASQSQPRDPHQEPAHVCRFDKPTHTCEKT